MGLDIITTGLVPPDDGPTPIPGTCTFTFLKNANCRSGPGVIYPILTSEVAGTMAPVIGRNPEATWYKIQLPDVACWIKADLGSLDCDPKGLLILQIPPTPTPVPVQREAPTDTDVPQPQQPDPCGIYTTDKECARNPNQCTWNGACVSR